MLWREMVGATRFEHATSWTQTRRSTKLSYAPKREAILAELNDKASLNQRFFKGVSWQLQLCAQDS